MDFIQINLVRNVNNVNNQNAQIVQMLILVMVANLPYSSFLKIILV